MAAFLSGGDNTIVYAGVAHSIRFAIRDISDQFPEVDNSNGACFPEGFMCYSPS